MSAIHIRKIWLFLQLLLTVCHHVLRIKWQPLKDLTCFMVSSYVMLSDSWIFNSNSKYSNGFFVGFFVVNNQVSMKDTGSTSWQSKHFYKGANSCCHLFITSKIHCFVIFARIKISVGHSFPTGNSLLHIEGKSWSFWTIEYWLCAGHAQNFYWYL